jgi:putative endonuclease
MKPWYLYIIKCSDHSLYTGIATDVERRFIEHLTDPKKGAKFFRGRGPEQIVYLEEFADRSEASKRESHIKSLSRKQKEALVKQFTESF